MPILYVVATPIGNLEDITLRALRILQEVDLIAAEDTRISRRLLSKYDIDTPLTSYHEHNKIKKIPKLIANLKNLNIALVSDAGTPMINDPGQELVAKAQSEGFQVIGLPGASALTTAVAISGIQMSGFVYLGFLPRKLQQRRLVLKQMNSEQKALVVFETPHRLRSALKDILVTLGDRKLAICRELTKRYEETFKGTVSEALEHFDMPRGEFTLVVSGARKNENNQLALDPLPILEEMRRRHLSARDAVAQASAVTGIGRRELYRIWISLTNASKHHPPI